MARTADFPEAVRRVWSTYCAHMLSGDMDQWITLWDEEGVQMPPDTPMRRGKTIILQKMKSDLQAVRYVTFAIEVVGAVASGDLGVAHGTYAYSFVRAQGGETHARAGKYLTVFRKQADGSWRILRDCFNLDAPAR